MTKEATFEIEKEVISFRKIMRRINPKWEQEKRPSISVLFDGDGIDVDDNAVVLKFKATGPAAEHPYILRSQADLLDRNKPTHSGVDVSALSQGGSKVYWDPLLLNAGIPNEATYVPVLDALVFFNIGGIHPNRAADAFAHYLKKVSTDWLNHDVSDLHDSWKRALLEHYRQNQDATLSKLLPSVFDSLEAGRYHKLLRVPSKYKQAYRLMVNLPTEVVHELAGDSIEVNNRQKPVLVRGCTYKPKADLVSSWTVNRRMFTDPTNLNKIGFVPTAPGRWLLLLQCFVQESPNKFLFNPDTLPHYLKTGNYGAEREIISVGNVKVNRVIAVQALSKVKVEDVASMMLRATGKD